MIAPDAKPRLPRGVRLTHNAAHGGWVLLAPERLFKADVVAADRRIALGKKSGLANIKIKLDELGLNAPAEKHGALLEKVKSLGTAEKRLVTDREFRAMVAELG